MLTKEECLSPSILEQIRRAAGWVIKRMRNEQHIFLNGNTSSDLFEELVQEGCIEALKCAKTYDPVFGTEFSTYPFPHLRQAMLWFAREKRSLFSKSVRKVLHTQIKMHDNIPDRDNVFEQLEEAMSQLTDRERQAMYDFAKYGKVLKKSAEAYETGMVKLREHFI